MRWIATFQLYAATCSLPVVKSTSICRSTRYAAFCLVVYNSVYGSTTIVGCFGLTPALSLLRCIGCPPFFRLLDSVGISETLNLLDYTTKLKITKMNVPY